MVVKQQALVEHLAQQTAGLVKVIGTAILSPETVMSILQPEAEGKEERGVTGEEEGIEVEPGNKGVKNKKA